MGISTVPEAIAARQCGLRVCGLSCITNSAARSSNAFAQSCEVLAAGANTSGRAAKLLPGFASGLEPHPLAASMGRDQRSALARTGRRRTVKRRSGLPRSGGTITKANLPRELPGTSRGTCHKQMFTKTLVDSL